MMHSYVSYDAYIFNFVRQELLILPTYNLHETVNEYVGL